MILLEQGECLGTNAYVYVIDTVMRMDSNFVLFFTSVPDVPRSMLGEKIGFKVNDG